MRARFGREQRPLSRDMSCLSEEIKENLRDMARRLICVAVVAADNERKRLKWFEHLNRLRLDQTTTRVYIRQTKAGSSRGAPRIRWIEREIKII